MKKTIFALLICIAVAIGVFAVCAYADETYYTVTFDTQGRGSVAEVTVEANKPLPDNIKPAGDYGGKCFHGWLLNGSAYNLSTPVTSSITLVADWRDHTNAKTTSDSCTESQNVTLICSFCNEEYSTTLPARGHSLTDAAAQQPTCTEVGWDAYQYCTYDNCDYSTKVEKQALGHQWKTVERVEPTCGTAGTEAYEECERCQAKNPDTAPVSIPATGIHSWSETVSEEYLKQAATCSSPAEYYKSCSVCGAKNESESFSSGSATGNHNFINNICTECNAKRASVTVTIQGSGTGTLNGENIVSGETVYLNDGQKVSMVFTPDTGYQLTDILENGQARSNISMPYEYYAVAGTPDFAVRAIFSATASKTVAPPRQQLLTSGDAVTKAASLAGALSKTYKLTDASSIQYAVYNVTPVWSDGTEMNQDEIKANGGIAFVMAAPSGTSATTHRYVVYHYGSSGTYSYVTNSLSVATSDFSPFAAFAIPLSASSGDSTGKITPAAPTVTPVNMERVDDKVTKTGGFSVLNAAYPIEYRQDGSTAGYISVTGNTVSGLTAGRYYVRYAATATTNASGDTLTPIVIDDYYTVSTKLLYGKGTVYSDDSAGYADNVYLVKKGNNITFRFEPASHYWLHEIRINDQYVGQSNVKTPYVLRNVTKHVDLAYGFSDSSASPKTGDESNVGLWIAVGAVSAVAIAGIAFYLIKKKK